MDVDERRREISLRLKRIPKSDEPGELFFLIGDSIRCSLFIRTTRSGRSLLDQVADVLPRDGNARFQFGHRRITAHCVLFLARAQRQRSASSADRPIVIPPHERFRIAATGLAGGSAAVVLHRPQGVHFADPTATPACGAGLGQELNELRARGGRLFHHGGVITPQDANRHPTARPPSALHLQDVPGSLQPPCPIALRLCNSQVQPVPSQRHVLVRRAPSLALGARGFFIMARVITRQRRKSPAGESAAAAPGLDSNTWAE